MFSGEIAERLLGNFGKTKLLPPRSQRNRMQWTFNESLIWHSLALLLTEVREKMGLFLWLPPGLILGKAQNAGQLPRNPGRRHPAPSVHQWGRGRCCATVSPVGSKSFELALSPGVWKSIILHWRRDLSWMNNQFGLENSIQLVFIECTVNPQCSGPGAGTGRKQGWEKTQQCMKWF